jgi:hypothetical protein
MAQELTFSMLAHALQSTCDGPNPYVTVLLTFLQSVLWITECLAALECAISWTELAAFLSQGPSVSSKSHQGDKLSQQSILLEDWGNLRNGLARAATLRVWILGQQRRSTDEDGNA